jgi:hypothetical protein
MTQPNQQTWAAPKSKSGNGTAADADPGAMPTIAAFALGLAGLTHAALGFQFLTLWSLRTVEWSFMVVLLVAGILATLVAWQLGQARSWAAIVGALFPPVLGLMSLVFSVYALWNMSFALYMLFAPPAAGIAMFVVPFAIAPCRRAEKASAELRSRYASGPFAGVLDR